MRRVAGSDEVFGERCQPFAVAVDEASRAPRRSSSRATSAPMPLAAPVMTLVLSAHIEPLHPAHVVLRTVAVVRFSPTLGRGA